MRRPDLTLAALTLGAAVLAGIATAQDGPPTARPPFAKPGECFGRTARPPTYTREAHRVQVRAPHFEERVRQGVIGVEMRRTLVRPARTLRERIPALYRTIAHVIASPGPSYWVRTAPEYRFERVQVLIAPAHSEWRRAAPRFAYQGAAPGQTMVEPTGEVLCRVFCPARYGVEERRVLVTPGRAYRERGPAIRRVFRERVLVRPAGVVERRVAAVYRFERIEHVLRRPVRERVFVPGETRVVVSGRAHRGGEGWSRVFCSGPLAPGFVSHLQGALNARGYDAGEPDGRETSRMHHALRRWQRDHRLPEGQVTVESARALGVAP